MKRPGRIAAIVVVILALVFIAGWWTSGVVEKDVDFVVFRGGVHAMGRHGLLRGVLPDRTALRRGTCSPPL